MNKEQAIKMRSCFANLIGTVNADYKIIEQGNKAVIGKLESSYGTHYVAWSYTFSIDGTPNYYWGRYSDDFNFVKECFNKKEQGLYSGD